jgi:hypothetical protein
MGVKTRLDDMVGTTTDVSVLLREVCIVALFCLLFFAPDSFKSLLTRIGISKVSTVFGDIDVASAGGTVANLDRGLSDTIDRLTQIETTSTDPQAKADIGKVTDYLKSLQQEAQTTDESIKTTLATQAATDPASAPAAKTGWLFAGGVDKDMLHWKNTKSVVPANLSPKLTVNEKFNVASPAYLRDNYSKGKVIGVLRTNTEVQVTAPPKCLDAMAGGYFCWVQVQAQ